MAIPSLLKSIPRTHNHNSLRGNFFYAPKLTSAASSYLRLSDGSTWPGIPVGAPKSINGEIVFSTGMIGYVESLTDPSYYGQILTFTFPLIGNYGVPPPHAWESSHIQVRGVILSSACARWSHWQGERSLTSWLRDEGVPCLAHVDTRTLTRRLRQHGVMLGAIVYQGQDVPFVDPNQEDLVASVTVRKIVTVGKGKKRVILVDCGAKESIIHSLLNRNVRVIRVPYDYDFTSLEAEGIVVSNGPGDPLRCRATIQILKKAMRQNRPIFGICLGSQLMGLAAGASTYKLPYGHRGQNQPCVIEGTRRCVLTSQNHGYAVREKTIPHRWRTTFRNANDHSVEGIAHHTKPFFSVQFHPEAHPGPDDTNYLFDKFVKLL